MKMIVTLAVLVLTLVLSDNNPALFFTRPLSPLFIILVVLTAAFPVTKEKTEVFGLSFLHKKI